MTLPKHVKTAAYQQIVIEFVEKVGEVMLNIKLEKPVLKNEKIQNFKKERTFTNNYNVVLLRFRTKWTEIYHKFCNSFKRIA